MTLPELKAEIVIRRAKNQDCSALVVLCYQIERELAKRSKLMRIMNDPNAIEKLCEDDKALERLLVDIDNFEEPESEPDRFQSEE